VYVSAPGALPSLGHSGIHSLAVDDLRRVAAGLAVIGIGSIAQRFARAVVPHQEVGLIGAQVD
jgi:hypothetical protein